MNPSLSAVQLDALRELANIASGTAATALSQMLDRGVEINVPRALALPPADAVEACGDPEAEVAGAGEAPADPPPQPEVAAEVEAEAAPEVEAPAVAEGSEPTEG